MSARAGERLYGLLPSVYRIRDAEQGEPLRALLAVVEEQLLALDADTGQLYDDWFIETCAPWVVPYIGNLLGLEGGQTVGEGSLSQRAYVANTLAYRRRKGTAAVLENLAHDVTGWPARAVEFFQRMTTTQNLNHVRLPLLPDSGYHGPNAEEPVGTAGLRSLDVADRIDGPFDVYSHTVDVRRIRQDRGWHSVRHVGIFLWRLNRYSLAGTPARRAAAPFTHGYHFSTLGNPVPLFNSPEAEFDDRSRISELDVPGAIRPPAFHADLEAFATEYGAVPAEKRPSSSDYYGPERSVSVFRDGVLVSPLDVVCSNLSEWARPPAGKVAVDVRRGRLAFAEGEEPARVDVSYNYGFSADMGGGPYDRQRWPDEIPEAHATIVACKNPEPGSGEVSTIQQALAAWADMGKPDCVIEICDNGVYGGLIAFEPADGRTLVIRARNGYRPTLRLTGNLLIEGEHPEAVVTLNGLLVEGAMEVRAAAGGERSTLGELNLVHCTLVPGRGLSETGEPLQPAATSLRVEGPNETLRIRVLRSILGPLRLPAEMDSLVVEDSIVDASGGIALARTDAADGYGPPTTLVRSTVFGGVRARELTLVSDSILTGVALAERRQAGCVRFSYLPEESRTPRRYRCQPELAVRERANELRRPGRPAELSPVETAEVGTQLRPQFTSTRYGTPAYAQLALTCAEEIRTGAEDGSEMGAFNHLKQPQREANLRASLDEYLRFGMEAGLIYVT